jgi:hypothetical protein
MTNEQASASNRLAKQEDSAERTTEERYRAALQQIVDRPGLDGWRPDRTHPTEFSKSWSEGHHCGLLAAKHVAERALDPEAVEETEKFIRFVNSASDGAYYRRTGHCGTCGFVADTCQCQPKQCGCWPLHGPPKAPWVPVEKRLAAAEERLVAVLSLCDAAERGALRWEQPLPVPEWVHQVREAATGEPQQQALFATEATA